MFLIGLGVLMLMCWLCRRLSVWMVNFWFCCCLNLVMMLYMLVLISGMVW